MRWRIRLHRSTLIVLLAVLAILILVNIPGEPVDVHHPNDYLHGWPWHYLTRYAKPNPISNPYWSFAGQVKQVHASGIAVNILFGLLLLCLVGIVCEAYIRGYGGVFRFSLRGLLGLTAAVAILLAIGMREVIRCRTQSALLSRLQDHARLTIQKRHRPGDAFRSLLPDGAGRVRDLEVRGFDDLADEHLEGFEALVDLYDLQIVGRNVTGESLPLSRLPSLRQVRLSGGITDRAMEVIASATKLAYLEITSNQITDDGLKNIPKLKSLSVLCITSPSITANGLRHIGRCSALETLQLTNVAVGDDAVLELVNSVPLKRLVLIDTVVSKQIASAVQAVLPNTQVIVLQKNVMVSSVTGSDEVSGPTVEE